MSAPRLRHSPLDDAHRRAGAKLVDFGGWEMPLAYPTGTVGRAPGLPHRRRRLRREPPRHGPGRGPGGARAAAAAPQQRPPQDRRRAGPVHAPARRGGRLGRRRHHRVVARRRSLRRHAQRLEHRPGARGHRAARTPRPPGPSSPCRARGRASAWRAVSPEAAAVAAFRGGGRSSGRAPPAWWPGPATPGEDGVECAVPADVAAALLAARSSTAASCPAGLGARDTLRLEAGLPLHGHELGPGSPRCRPAWAGWSGGTRETSVGRRALERRARRGVRAGVCGVW